ncbi:MAG: type II secretion system protein GspD [Alphaproteobacteria bacterium]|nr:MAG: type II secretion system protein GspD [Alphaproteobacteria bacterium]
MNPGRGRVCLLLPLLVLTACTTPGHEDRRPAPPPGLFEEPQHQPDRKKGGPGESVTELSTGRRLEKPEIFSGSQNARLGTARRTVQVAPAEGGLSLNFVDAPLRDVVEAVLGEALGQNYVIDPGTDARITARSARPIAKDRLVAVLEDILALHNLALLKRGEGYRILPIDKASSVSADVLHLAATTAEGGGFGFHIIPLRYAQAAAVRDAVQPTLVPGRTVLADDARNLLIFRGPGSEAEDVVALVELFDVDWLKGMHYGLFPLESADVASVIPELEAIFGLDEARPGSMPAAVRFLPIERMNAVLVISPSGELVQEAQNWVERLDRGEGVAGKRQLFVYRLKAARAEDVAEVLSGLFEVQLAANQSSSAGFGGFGDVAPGRRAGQAFGLAGSNAGGRAPAGTPAARSTAGSTRPASGTTAAPARSTAFGRRNSRSTFSPHAAQGIGGAAGQPVFHEGPRIIADGRNDALLVYATPQEYRMIERTIKRLDIAPLQVLIEATIAEVSLNDALQFGLRWFFQNEGATGRRTNTVTFSDLGNGGVNQQFPGFSYLFTGRSAQVALNTLSDLTKVNVVSSPQLMVLDNGTARLQVGDQVPVPTQQSVSTLDPNAPIVNAIDFRDTGVILEVTPHVNASGLVVLDVRQEVSDVVPTTTSGIDAPTIQRRVIESTVAVQNGETIALGGLIRDSRNRTRSGIPVLSRLPLFGPLFGTTTNKKDRTELLVLLTPRVVRDAGEARAVTRELRERLYGLESLRKQFAVKPASSPDAKTPPARNTASGTSGPEESRR